VPILRPRRSSCFLRRVLLAALVGVLLPWPASAAPQPGAEGIGDGYFPLDGNGGIDVQHYAIDDRYRFGKRRLSGRTTLTVVATEELSSFQLDFLLPVTEVLVDGVPAAFSRPHSHELRIEPDSYLAAGEEFLVEVAYAGRPGRFRYAGQRNWLADRREVVAMNQPHMAPWWFPSNDHPADKALMDIRITVPRGKQVAANGRLVGRRNLGRLTRHHWRADEPMATYLAMFAAGPFRVERGVTRDGLPWRLLVSRQLGRNGERASMRMLRRTAGVIHTLEQDLGRYPFSSAGGLVTGLPVGFALENQTIPTYFAVSDGGHGWLVVHEQAHQWFGDSVSVARWRDLWLNEGAASFMEVRYAERRGRLDAQRWLRRTHGSLAPDDPFWDLPISDPGPERMFADPVYLRGAMTFQALRHRVGGPEFWALVRTWLRRHRDGNASTAEFEALAEQVSGEELDGFFEAWLRSGDRPAVSVANGLR
jgi:aminopeptidase N